MVRGRPHVQLKAMVPWTLRVSREAPGWHMGPPHRPWQPGLPPSPLDPSPEPERAQLPRHEAAVSKDTGEAVSYSFPARD